jgi:hypothetical protein
MTKLEKQVLDRITNLSNEELIKILTDDPDTYTPFALDVAQRELDRRGGKSLLLEHLRKSETKILRQNTGYSAMTQNYAKPKRWHWGWYILGGLILLSALNSMLNDQRDNHKQSSFNQPVQPLPPNGIFKQYVFVIMGTPQAPLTIITGESGYHYFVKLVDWTKGHEVLTLFIRSGQSASVNVPLGSYKMKYAAGKQWYGESYLFGPETSYNEADKKFDFELRDNHVSGYTVELFLQPQGNLRTNRISAREF